MADMASAMREWNIKTEAPILREAKNPEVYFIRHGLSMHNIRCLQFQKEYGKNSE